MEDADDQDVAEAVAAVRQELLGAWQGEFGVFQSLRPWHVVCVLGGARFFSGIPNELMYADEYFFRLGARVRRFLGEFDRRRRRAGRGRAQYVPNEKRLRQAFGDDWQLVQAAWPAVRFLGSVAKVARRHTDLHRLMAAMKPWKEEAAVFLVGLDPHEFEIEKTRGQLRVAVRRFATKFGGELRSSEIDAIVDDALLPSRALERALSYEPSGDAQRAYNHCVAAYRNRVRDLVRQPVVLGNTTNGDEVRRATGTLRRWKWEKRVTVIPGEPTRALLNAALEADARRMHRDHLGDTWTATEVGILLGYSERSVRSAIRKAVAAGVPEPGRLRGGRSYALTKKDLSAVKPFLGARRGPKQTRTVRVIARMLRVAPSDVLAAIRAHVASLQTRGHHAELQRVLKSMDTGNGAAKEPEFSYVSDALLKVVKRRLHV